MEFIDVHGPLSISISTTLPFLFQDASRWTNTDAQRKDSVDTRDFLLQRPRRESNSSGGLSETESQAEPGPISVHVMSSQPGFAAACGENP